MLNNKLSTQKVKTCYKIQISVFWWCTLSDNSKVALGLNVNFTAVGRDLISNYQRISAAKNLKNIHKLYTGNLLKEICLL